MKKTVCLILVISLLLITLSGCSSSNSIVGKWGNDEIELEFFKNGDAVFREGSETGHFKYEVLSDKDLKLTAKIEFREETEIFDYSIENNTLLIMDLELKKK
ncbi:hypothetical protein [Alkaliphilus metalliredigens]|uniref:hypothetical protein n=1 Tax=Alkaliphilus metalliredigens TaxID=208226 RepID=UPI0002E48058|nr:hypothetical protein [Alkaliphilus metalliredigens]